MLISNTFRIKGKYGPVAGLTYYTTDTFDEPSTEISNFDVTDAPLDSFSGPTQCGAYTENETVEGGTISGYLLGSNGAMLTSTAENSGSPCVGMVKILAVMNMSEDLTISDATKGLKVTFIVSDLSLIHI